MKKTVLFLFAIVCMALSSESQTITIQPQPQSRPVVCRAGNVYWPSSDYVCCDISCSNGFFFSICRWTYPGRITDNYTSTPTLHGVDIDVSLPSGNYTAEQLLAYQNFKDNGVFVIPDDFSSIASNGRLVITKAGTYGILGGKLQCLISQSGN